MDSLLHFCRSGRPARIFADRHLTKLFGDTVAEIWPGICSNYHFRQGAIIMKLLRPTVLGSLVGGAFLTLAGSSYGAFQGRHFNHTPLANDIRNDRKEIQQERQDLREDRTDLDQDREKLREDRRDDASHAERANDRADIRRDRRDIIRDRHDLRDERQDLKEDLEREHHSWFDRWRWW
jgi:hypothetical protein